MKDYEERIKKQNVEKESMTLHQKKRSEERVEALEKSDKEVNNLKAKASALEDGTT